MLASYALTLANAALYVKNASSIANHYRIGWMMSIPLWTLTPSYLVALLIY